MKKVMGKWLSVMRLRTLPLAVSGVLVGTSLAFKEQSFNGGVFGLCILTAMLLQVLSNLANDLGDFQKGADGSGRIGPSRALQSGSLSIRSMKMAIAIFGILSLISGICLLMWAQISSVGFAIMMAMGLLAIAAALLYTLGKRPYGYNALGDVAVFAFFGPLVVIGSAYLMTGTVQCMWWVFTAISGMPAVAVLNLNNMRDAENDLRHGKRTVAGLIGISGARIYHVILLSIALIALALWNIHIGTLRALLPFAVVPLWLWSVRNVWSTDSPVDLDKELKPLARSVFLIGLLMAAAAIG